jgi:WD40 repeat protein
LFSAKGKFINGILAKEEYCQLEINDKGNKIATGTETGNIYIFNNDGNLILKFRPFSKTISEIAFSPDGESIAIGSVNSDAGIYNFRTKKTIKLGHSSFKLGFYSFFEKSYNDIKQISYSKDGNFIIIRSDFLISLWNCNAGLVSKFYGHSGKIRNVSFSEDGKYIISISKDQAFIFRDYSGKLLYRALTNQKYVSKFIFDEQKEVLVTISGKNKINLYRVEKIE